MKGLAKIIIFLISFSSLNAQWFSQSPLPTMKDLNGDYFVVDDIFISTKKFVLIN